MRRRSTPARGGRALSVLLLALLTALGVLGGPLPGPAYADPTVGPELPGTQLPVSVRVTAVTPQAVGPDAKVTVRATLTNTGAAEVGSLQWRLQRDRRQTTRSEMTLTDTDPPDYQAQVTGWTQIDGTLAPGGTVQVTLTSSVDELGIFDDGVYPLLVNVNGVIDGAQSRVGQAATYLPYFAAAPTARISVGWLWPLVDRPHRRSGDDVFVDDDLAASVRPGGRLDKLLTAAEKYSGATRMTLLVDPMLVSDLVAMADGYQVQPPTGSRVTGSGSQDAADFLTRLRVLATAVPVAALAYADPDTVALTRAGLGPQVTDARTYGVQLLRQQLGVAPVADLDWPADGLLTEAALRTEQSAGVRTVVVAGAAFGQPDALSSPDGVTENPATTLPGTPGVTALAVDGTLSRIVADGETYAAGPALARQRFVSELASVLAQAPSRSRSVLVVPPRDWDPTVGYAQSMLSASSLVPWTGAVSVDTLTQDPPQDRGALVYPAAVSVQEIPGGPLTQLAAGLSDITDLGSAMSEADARTQLGPYRRAVWRASSNAYRGDPDAVVAAGTDLSAALAGLRNRVSILLPEKGLYTLSSSSAPLVFTVENRLPVAVSVRIAVGDTDGVGLDAVDKGVHEVAPNSRATITVPARVERSGTFTITARITTPDGRDLGSSDTRLRVRSTAYGGVALWVTGAALALLLALFTRRGLRWVAARRAGSAPAPRVAARPDGTVRYERARR